MLQKGKLYEFGNEPRRNRDPFFTDRAVFALTDAFFSSHDTQEFQQALDSFIKMIVDTYPSVMKEQNERLIELILHIIPQSLLDTLPIITKKTKIEKTPHSPDLLVTYQDPNEGEVSTTISKEELEHVLRYARRYIQNTLTHRGIQRTHIVDHLLSKDGGAISLHSEKIFKPGRPDPYGFYHARALETLYALPDRSPHLAYPNTTFAQESGWSVGSTDLMLRSRLPIHTLQELLRENNPSFRGCLMVLADAVQGLIFLEKRGLCLTDLDPSNIGISTETGQGMLFDYGGLTPNGATVGYVGKRMYIPPEGLGGNKNRYDDVVFAWEVPITSRQSVYELGVTLKNILTVIEDRHYPYNQDTVSTHIAIDSLRQLEKHMMQFDPDQRPTLQECLDQLVDTIIRYPDAQHEHMNQPRRDWREDPGSKTMRGHVQRTK